ncbi:hypothetical protein L9F63_008172, partial [Diploptera punctata]
SPDITKKDTDYVNNNIQILSQKPEQIVDTSTMDLKGNIPTIMKRNNDSQLLIHEADNISNPTSKTDMEKIKYYRRRQQYPFNNH